jgi:hypothetical protein
MVAGGSSGEVLRLGGYTGVRPEKRKRNASAELTEEGNGGNGALAL